MTSKRARAVFNALKDLSALKMRVRDAIKIAGLIRGFEPAFSAGIKEEEELLKEHKGTILPDGSVGFGSEEDRRAFVKDKLKADAKETHVEYSPVTLEAAGLGQQYIEPAVLIDLDGVVDFE